MANRNKNLICNHIDFKIDKTQETSNYRLFSNRDETIKYLSEYSNLAKKEYKNRHVRVRRSIYKEQCKRLWFEHTNEWYMYKIDSLKITE